VGSGHGLKREPQPAARRKQHTFLGAPKRPTGPSKHKISTIADFIEETDIAFECVASCCATTNSTAAVVDQPLLHHHRNGLCDRLCDLLAPSRTQENWLHIADIAVGSLLLLLMPDSTVARQWCPGWRLSRATAVLERALLQLLLLLRLSSSQLTYVAVLEVDVANEE
jgi:hypothetical protein